ncbi:unnamed protein product [Polarella glacialis]|uniref:Uncharacterized protein n=1 Tax=Polarella glacialis TaxID=89957 RepID=A0A813IB44_POLGL|nr:unnamed protein product [Polarella glacialis]
MQLLPLHSPLQRGPVDAGVQDERVDRGAEVPQGLAEAAHRAQVAQFAGGLEAAHRRPWHLLLNGLRGLQGRGPRATGRDHLPTLRGQLNCRREADAGVGACDHGPAPLPLRRACPSLRRHRVQAQSGQQPERRGRGTALRPAAPVSSRSAREPQGRAASERRGAGPRARGAGRRAGASLPDGAARPAAAGQAGAITDSDAAAPC